VESKTANLARLALCTEVTITGSQLADHTIKPRITFVRRSTALFNGRFQIHDSQLQDVNKVRLVKALEVRVALQLGEVACPHVIDAFRQQLVQAVRLCRHQQLHTARLCQQKLFTLFLHLHYLILFGEW